MSRRFSGKTVLVTGSAGGLGRSFAEAFSREGASLILVDINMEGLAETKRRLEASGGVASVHRADLSSEQEIRALAAAVLAAHAKLDVLINNAGIAYGEITTGFANLPMEKWEQYFRVNTLAPLFLAEALRPALARAKGLIINQSSMASATPATAYGVTKAALNAMTFGMATQFAADEIRAVAIAPGLMDTEANRTHLPAEKHAQIQGLQLVKRGGTAEDIANMAVFFASDEGSFINNELVFVDGGSRLRGWRM